jgi:hypothetical protein
MRKVVLSTIGIALFVGSLVLAGCGGSDNREAVYGETTTTTPSSGRVALTADACDTLRGVISRVQDFTAANVPFDYPKDVAAMDNFADNVTVPDEVADSVKTFRTWFDSFGAAVQDVGLAPNNEPLPDQLDELISKAKPSDDVDRAAATLYTWTGNDCS